MGHWIQVHFSGFQFVFRTENWKDANQASWKYQVLWNSWTRTWNNLMRCFDRPLWTHKGLSEWRFNVAQLRRPRWQRLSQGFLSSAAGASREADFKIGLLGLEIVHKQIHFWLKNINDSTFTPHKSKSQTNQEKWDTIRRLKEDRTFLGYWIHYKNHHHTELLGFIKKYMLFRKRDVGLRPFIHPVHCSGYTESSTLRNGTHKAGDWSPGLAESAMWSKESHNLSESSVSAPIK